MQLSPRLVGIVPRVHHQLQFAARRTAPGDGGTCVRFHCVLLWDRPGSDLMVEWCISILLRCDVIDFPQSRPLPHLARAFQLDSRVRSDG
jgi:hypothetical protein